MREPICMVAFCSGYVLYWTERKEGEKLQGWYKSKEEAQKAWAVLVECGVG